MSYRQTTFITSGVKKKEIITTFRVKILNVRVSKYDGFLIHLSGNHCYNVIAFVIHSLSKLRPLNGMNKN